MKTLRKTREYLESNFPYLSKSGDTHIEFYLRLKELLPRDKELLGICKMNLEEDSLEIEPIDTFIKYEYEEDKLIGIYISHPELEKDDDIFPLQLNDNREAELIKYFKRKDFSYYDEKYMDMKDFILEQVGNSSLPQQVLAAAYWGHSGVVLIQEDYTPSSEGLELRKTLYITELNTLITIYGGKYTSWSGIDWDEAEYYISHPITDINTIYVKDEV